MIGPRRSLLALCTATLAAMLVPSAAAAACYDDPQHRAISRKAPAVYRRELLLLVDQTVALPADVRQHVLDVVRRLSVPGTRVSVGSFSAYTPTTHPRVLGQHSIEPDFPAGMSGDVSMRGLANFRRCIRDKRPQALAAVQQLTGRVMAQNRPTIGQSDIMSSLQQFGGHLRASRLPQKVVVLVSDMLENSSTTSFYARGSMKMIDPAAELTRVRRAKLFANLAGARVLVIGAGLFSTAGDNAHRANEKMQKLEAFWRAYLASSGASSMLFGKPVLLVN